ncbi:leucyl-cystinyl aminopeptidase-like isoform X2 [Xenia sp. Carnegie-2017]|uniref:leucyl-cystinyl aminopeptidase-like isoform X2 n=1 Tax=Xenia sp. Carnegie-2017 TaxID=2897299 RepID=UPI001F0420FE|nr:leucyl-cystinyl aminopeptidase-like isoform X2 [Xenia sp. Carnegie-2017]XP_046858483.1 leucyl-cystinyl aminopeptidase-like isoform X2 [Xenia sp. Carnegie-2017]
MKFPSKKLDIVAMPDMKETAMENWGLITIRREFVVDEENLMTTFSKEMTAGEIARALAHTWFGNLVTMKWWNEVWLKDGFSTFVTNLARYNMDKKTDWLALSTVLYWQSALDNDRSLYTVPLLNTKTTSKDTINSGVVYSKGAMIAKMVMNTLGPSAFLKGLKLYIRNNMYGNADATDLWQSLSKFGKRLDLKQKMKSWTDLKSFPIVTLTRLKGPEKDLILAKQENFLEHRFFDVKANTRAVVKKPKNNSSFDFQESEKITGSLWHIPLTYTVQSTAFKEYTVVG